MVCVGTVSGIDLGYVQSMLTKEELVNGRDSTPFRSSLPFICVDEAERLAWLKFLIGKTGVMVVILAVLRLVPGKIPFPLVPPI